MVKHAFLLEWQIDEVETLNAPHQTDKA